MYRTRATLVGIAMAAALFSAACASQPSTGATTGAPVRPDVTPTSAAAPAATRPAAAPTTAPAAAPTTAAAAPTTAPAAAPTTAAAAPTTAPAAGGDATKGKAKFTGDSGCSACHGDKAQGNVFPGALKLSGTALTADQVKAQVRKPRDPSKGMPPFAESQVSDADIANMYAWFQTKPAG